MFISLVMPEKTRLTDYTCSKNLDADTVFLGGGSHLTLIDNCM